MNYARLTRYGVLLVSGNDARDFLHAQLTQDVEHLSQERAALAGWCSAKGRLLASFLVLRMQDGYLLQLARDLAPAVAKRLSMFILRSKVKIADESDQWAQFGVWGALDGVALPEQPFAVAAAEQAWFVKVGDGRYLVLARNPALLDGRGAPAPESRWVAEEIRAERPLITAATQDLFVPQMVNYEKLGAVDFKKGCYPGQEIVARAQYRGEVKRRMVRLPAPAGAELKPGQAFNGGVVVDSAEGELLAVMPV